MLERLRLRSFKRFDNVGAEIDFGRITVFIGANGTGKSSILQSLLLLKQSLNHSEFAYGGPEVNLGSFRDVAHLQILPIFPEIVLRVGYTLREPIPHSNPPLPRRGAVGYQIEFGNGIHQQVATLFGHRGEIFSVAARGYPNEGSSQRVTIDGETGQWALRFTTNGTIGVPFDLAVEGEASSDRMLTYIYARQIADCVPNLLKSIRFIPAVRGLTQFSYRGSSIMSPPSAEDLNGTGELARAIAADPDLLDDLSELLSAVVGSDYRLRSRMADGQIALDMGRRKLAINLVNEAFGLNQLIMPFVALVQAEPESVIAIEEPESHLHPKAQTALCKTLVRLANEGPKQLILTTHSEHILTGLLAAVSRGELRAKDLAVYELHREGEAARAERLPVNDQGQISGGLRGFMDADLDDIGELIAMLSKAEQERDGR